MAEQTPVLAMLKSFLDVNNNSLYRFARYDPNSLRFWVAAVSMQLARIYGNDSQYLAAFPLITENLPKAEVGRLNRALTVDRFLDSGSRRLLSFAL